MRHETVKVTSVTVSMIVLVMVSLLSGVGPLLLVKVSAAEMGTRSLELNDSTAGASSVTYDTSFQITTAGTLGSIEFEFCSNSTLPVDPCSVPTGLDVSKAVFTQESGISGFTISSETANDILISRPPSSIGTVTAGALFGNITNPTNAGSYYLRVLTYPTQDGSGPYTDNGGMAFAIASPISVQVKVPPYLLFCTGNTISGTDCSSTSGDFIDLGQLLTTRTSTGQSQMVVATNAQNGYSITVNGGTLTSGNNTIPGLSTDSPSQIGVSQFGINLRANTSPAVGADASGPGSGVPTLNYDQPNLFRYVDGDIVATNSSVEDGRKFTVSYVTNISKSQPAGIYASTFTYVAMGNF